MNWIELLKITMPSLILLSGVIAVLYYFSKKETALQRVQLHTGNQKILTPVRLQAYERLSLLLERIHPEALIRRNTNTKLNAGQIKAVLVQSVRREFEHNLSQQIYISSNAWQAVRNAKEQIIRILNVTSSEISPEANSLSFLKAFLEQYNTLEIQPLETTSEILKKEVRQYFPV